jgi:hypothetical protein
MNEVEAAVRKYDFLPRCPENIDKGPEFMDGLNFTLHAKL